jgi:hypothetical protein
MSGRLIHDDAPHCVIWAFDYDDRTQWMAFFHADCVDYDGLTDIIPADAEMFRQGPAAPAWGEKGAEYIWRGYVLPAQARKPVLPRDRVTPRS